MKLLNMYSYRAENPHTSHPSIQDTVVTQLQNCLNVDWTTVVMGFLPHIGWTVETPITQPSDSSGLSCRSSHRPCPRPGTRCCCSTRWCCTGTRRSWWNPHHWWWWSSMTVILWWVSPGPTVPPSQCRTDLGCSKWKARTALHSEWSGSLTEITAFF